MIRRRRVSWIDWQAPHRGGSDGVQPSGAAEPQRGSVIEVERRKPRRHSGDLRDDLYVALPPQIAKGNLSHPLIRGTRECFSEVGGFKEVPTMPVIALLKESLVMLLDTAQFRSTETHTAQPINISRIGFSRAIQPGRAVDVRPNENQPETSTIPQRQRKPWPLAGEPRPEKYGHGPLIGTLAQICIALKQDRKTVKKHNCQGAHYVCCVHGSQFELWLADERKLQVCRANLEGSGVK